MRAIPLPRRRDASTAPLEEVCSLAPVGTKRPEHARPFVAPRGGARLAARCGHQVESPLARLAAEHRETGADDETHWPPPSLLASTRR